MPRHPCPHCPEFFITKPVLETHIHFIHNDGASQPVRSRPLVWTPPVGITRGDEVYTKETSAAAVAQPSRSDNAAISGATADAEGGAHGEYMSSVPRRLVLRHAAGGWAQPTPNSLSTGVPASGRSWVPETPRFQQGLPLNESTTLNPTPHPRLRRPPLRSVTNSIDTSIIRQEMWPAELQASKLEEQRRRSASPDRSGIPINPRAYKFVVVFESQEAQVQQRLEVPTSTLWPSFTALLQGASAPVAGTYIAGRKTGFTLDDGPWKYALVDHQGVRENRWRVLTSNLLYQAMISELMTHSAVWKHVLVCHDKQTVSGGRVPGAE